MIKSMQYVNFTPDRVARLKFCYDRARSLGWLQFRFQGSWVLTDYAKYLLEYLNLKTGCKF